MALFINSNITLTLCDVKFSVTGYIKVPVGLIRGKATRIVWPPGRWRRLENRTSEDRLFVEPQSASTTGSDSLRDTMLSLPTSDKQDTISNACKPRTAVADPDSITDLMYGPATWPASNWHNQAFVKRLWNQFNSRPLHTTPRLTTHFSLKQRKSSPSALT